MYESGEALMDPTDADSAMLSGGEGEVARDVGRLLFAADSILSTRERPSARAA